MTQPASPSPHPISNARLEAALRQIYPRLTVQADRTLRARNVYTLEAGDLCQDGILAATIYLRSLPEASLAALDDDGLRAVMFSVAARAMHGRLVDHIRGLAVRRRQPLSPQTDDGGAFARQQEARLSLSSLVRHARETERKALLIAVTAGDLDPAAIAQQLGVSRAHAYRLMKNIADRAGEE